MEDKIEIICKRIDSKGTREFWQKVQKAFDDGYRFDPEKTNRRDSPVLTRLVRIVLFKKCEKQTSVESPEEKEPIKSDDSIEESDIAVHDEADSADKDSDIKTSNDVLQELNKKDELIQFAKDHKIEIPEDLKHVKKIKKYLEENI